VGSGIRQPADGFGNLGWFRQKTFNVGFGKLDAWRGIITDSRHHLLCKFPARGHPLELPVVIVRQAQEQCG
jgi:hypothetical protein